MEPHKRYSLLLEVSVPQLLSLKCSLQRLVCRLKQFNGQGTWARAYWDHGDQALRSDADDGDVVGVFVDDQKEVATGIKSGRARVAACRYWGEQMPGKHGNGSDPVGERIGNENERGIAGHRAVGRSGAQEHGVGNFRPPGVNDFEAMRLRNADVEFAAVRFEKQRGGGTGQAQI